MNFIIQTINKLNEIVGKSVSWLTLVLVLLICFDVVRRSVFNETSAWVMELQWHLFALIFLLGAGYTLKHDKHVRVDVFYNDFKTRDKAQVNFYGTIFFLIPWLIVMIYFSFQYGLEAWHSNEGSPNPGGLPARYFIKFTIPFGLFLLLLQGIAQALESWKIIKQIHTSEENNSIKS